eukprot:3310384-Rhodomonas_salina.1
MSCHRRPTTRPPQPLKTNCVTDDSQRLMRTEVWRERGRMGMGDLEGRRAALRRARREAPPKMTAPCPPAPQPRDSDTRQCRSQTQDARWRSGARQRGAGAMSCCCSSLLGFVAPGAGSVSVCLFPTCAAHVDRPPKHPAVWSLKSRRRTLDPSNTSHAPDTPPTQHSPPHPQLVVAPLTPLHSTPRRLTACTPPERACDLDDGVDGGPALSGAVDDAEQHPAGPAPQRARQRVEPPSLRRPKRSGEEEEEEEEHGERGGLGAGLEGDGGDDGEGCAEDGAEGEEMRFVGGGDGGGAEGVYGSGPGAGVAGDAQLEALETDRGREGAC